MFKSLLYKEWLKVRWVFIGLAAVHCLVIVNLYFDVVNTFKIYSANQVISQYLTFEIIFYTDIMYLAPLTGLLLAVFQFFPEINQKRLKLTFHLPVKEVKLLSVMTSTGLSLLVGLFLVDTVLLSVINLVYFPKEFFYSMLLTTLPWYLGAVCTYAWVALIFIEPTWVKRIILIFIGLGTVMMYYAGSGYSAYSLSILYFILLTVLCYSIIFVSAYNFKRGIS